MKVTKLLLTAAVMLGLGLTACNNGDDPQPPAQEGNTHVSVSLTLSTSPSGSGLKSGNYNDVGTWAGQDKIVSIAVYVVDVVGGTVSSGQFETNDFTVSPSSDGTDQITIIPKKAIKTTAGDKKVYVLINAPQKAVAALATASASDFEAAYTSTALVLDNSGYSLTNFGTSASKLAYRNTAGEDVILMTNDPATPNNGVVTVVDGVTSEEALAAENSQNRAKVKIKRAAARVMVTTEDEEYEVKSPAGTLLGKITDFTWVVAQGENSLYIQQKPGLPDVIPVTPGSGYESTKDNYYGTTTDAAKYYDYSGLWEDNNTKGTTVPRLEDYAALNQAGDNQTEVLNSLGLTAKEVAGKFVLPNTHTYGATAEASKYKKGNTAYVLIRAIFTPTKFVDVETTPEKGDDVYVGGNGSFYSNAANSQDPEKGGVKGQTVAKYEGGKVLYFAWLNPDQVPGWLNSPVLRNNIYHIHIRSVKALGTNWNPLVPGDDPAEITDDANNPDPKPIVTIPNPDDPDGEEIPAPEPENPIRPEDPLTLPETWMSVDITVLPWQVHSYGIDLQ